MPRHILSKSSAAILGCPRYFLTVDWWKDFNDACQAKVDACKAVLAGHNLPITYVKIPSLWHPQSMTYTGGDPVNAQAWMSNMTNSLVIGDRIVMAKPYGPRDASGADIIEENVKDKLTGFNVQFIDDWEYNSRGGEIHCGTNAKRAPPTQNWWQ
jgi:hypothetical protein